MLPEHIKSIKGLLEYFPTEQSCIEHLELVRWKNIPVSPFDENAKVYKCKNGKYICKNTRKYFTVRNGSVFEKTKIPLRDWFLAIWLMNSTKKGVSSLQLMEHIGVTKSTAWFLGQKIRHLLGMAPEYEDLGIFQLDEAVFGGLNHNRRQDKKIQNSQGGHTPDKTWVLGMVQYNGEFRALAMPARSPEFAQLMVRKYIKPGSAIVTDPWRGYHGLDEYWHFVVKDGQRSYKNKPEIHTNIIEGAWGILKRGYMGIYNWWSKKYLQHYLNEYVFRYNTREMKICQRFSLFLEKVFRRIAYRDIQECTVWN
jgi:transposase-like protein